MEGFGPSSEHYSSLVTGLLCKGDGGHVSGGEEFLADDLRIDRLYVSCLGELKEIIVREGFPSRQPWQVKRRTIAPGQQGTNVLCATFFPARIKAMAILCGISAKGTSQLRVRATSLQCFRCCIGSKDSRKYLI